MGEDVKSRYFIEVTKEKFDKEYNYQHICFGTAIKGVSVVEGEVHHTLQDMFKVKDWKSKVKKRDA